MVMNGPIPTMLLMFNAVACSKPIPRTKPFGPVFSLCVCCKMIDRLRLYRVDDSMCSCSMCSLLAGRASAIMRVLATASNRKEV